MLKGTFRDLLSHIFRKRCRLILFRLRSLKFCCYGLTYQLDFRSHRTSCGFLFCLENDVFPMRGLALVEMVLANDFIDLVLESPTGVPS